MDLSFSAFMNMTKPGPQEPCPTCGLWSLRRYAEPASPDDEKVICTSIRCTSSPLYRERRPGER